MQHALVETMEFHRIYRTWCVQCTLSNMVINFEKVMVVDYSPGFPSSHIIFALPRYIQPLLQRNELCPVLLTGETTTTKKRIATETYK